MASYQLSSAKPATVASGISSYKCGICQNSIKAFELENHLKKHLTVCTKYCFDAKTNTLIPQLEKMDNAVGPVPAVSKTFELNARKFGIDQSTNLIEPNVLKLKAVKTQNVEGNQITKDISVPSRIGDTQTIVNKAAGTFESSVSSVLKGKLLNRISNKEKWNENENGDECTGKNARIDTEMVTKGTTSERNENMHGNPFTVGDVITRIEVPCMRGNAKLGIYECSVVVDRFIPVDDFTPEFPRNTDTLEGIDDFTLEMNIDSPPEYPDVNLNISDDMPEDIFKHEPEEEEDSTVPLENLDINQSLGSSYVTTFDVHDGLVTSTCTASEIPDDDLKNNGHKNTIIYMPESERHDSGSDSDETKEEKEQIEKELKQVIKKGKRRQQKKKLNSGLECKRLRNKKSLLYGLGNTEMTKLFHSELKKAMISDVNEDSALARYIENIPKTNSNDESTNLEAEDLEDDDTDMIMEMGLKLPNDENQENADDINCDGTFDKTKQFNESTELDEDLEGNKYNVKVEDSFEDRRQENEDLDMEVLYDSNNIKKERDEDLNNMEETNDMNNIMEERNEDLKLEESIDKSNKQKQENEFVITDIKTKIEANVGKVQKYKNVTQEINFDHNDDEVNEKQKAEGDIDRSVDKEYKGKELEICSQVLSEPSVGVMHDHYSYSRRQSSQSLEGDKNQGQNTTVLQDVLHYFKDVKGEQNEKADLKKIDDNYKGQLELDTFKCYFCECSFKDVDGYVGHMRAVHNVKTTIYVYDPKNHDSRKIFPCTECKKNFVTKADLNEHQMFNCQVINVKKIKDALQEDGITSLPPKVGKKRFHTKKENVAHKKERYCILSKTPKKSYKCDVCGLQYPSRELHSKHLFKEHSIRYYSCVKCGKVFESYYQLNKHKISIHGKIEVKKKKKKPSLRTTVCEKCGKSFGCFRAFREHMMKAHEGFRHKCSFCAAEFRSSHSWAMHEQRHKGVYNQFCATCQINYSADKTFVRHMKNQHNIDHFTARIIGRKTGILMQKLNPNTCSICKQVFPLDKVYFKHMKIKHNMSLDDAVKERSKIIEERRSLLSTMTVNETDSALTVKKELLDEQVKDQLSHNPSESSVASENERGAQLDDDLSVEQGDVK